LETGELQRPPIAPRPDLFDLVELANAVKHLVRELDQPVELRCLAPKDQPIVVVERGAPDFKRGFPGTGLPAIKQNVRLAQQGVCLWSGIRQKRLAQFVCGKRLDLLAVAVRKLRDQRL